MMLEGARHRANLEAARLAWLASMFLSSQVTRNDQWKVTPQRLVRGVPGFDPDPEDLVPTPEEKAHEDAPEVAGTPPKPTMTEGVAQLNALFDAIEAKKKAEE